MLHGFFPGYSYNQIRISEVFWLLTFTQNYNINSINVTEVDI